MTVKYCGVECQVAHRPAHRKACKKLAAELFDEKLFTQPPQREECPICMVTLSGNDSESAYMTCCGKMICIGCYDCLRRDYCPFCNTAMPTSDEEFIKRLSERIVKYDDPHATNLLGCYHEKGHYGLPVDQSKAFELFQRASELGSAAGHCDLGCSYAEGKRVAIDTKKAVHHWQIAAMMGNMAARHGLGYVELESGNHQRAMKHFMIAARCGCKPSLDVVKRGFRQGHVTKEDLERTLRSYQASCDETKSEQRDRAAFITAVRRE